MQKQSGFTLIELVIVLVLLGILAAVAVPRFIDLSEQAEESTLRAQAAALASASAINYAAFVAGSGDADGTVSECSDAADLVLDFDANRFNITTGDGAPFTLIRTDDGNEGETLDCGVEFDD